MSTIGPAVPKYKWNCTVKELDGWKCAVCGSEKRPEARHIVRQADNAEVSNDLSNGICLCFDCHRHLHKGDYLPNVHDEQREVIRSVCKEYAQTDVFVLTANQEQAEKFKAYCEAQGKTSNAVLREYILECIADNDLPTE